MGCGGAVGSDVRRPAGDDPVGWRCPGGRRRTRTAAAAFGSLATQKCSLAPETGGLMCYTGGDDGRDVTFNYRCHDAYGVPQVTQGEHITKYTIDMAGPGGCARVAGLSIGSLTLILSGVAAFVYIAAGIFYNHRYREVPLGVGAIPQWAYWKQLPGLVRDGCKFSYAEASYLYGRWSGRNVGGAHSPLKQGLKAADADAEGSGGYYATADEAAPAEGDDLHVRAAEPAEEARAGFREKWAPMRRASVDLNFRRKS